jgi:hypothetical protein
MFPNYSLVYGQSALLCADGYGGNRCISDIQWFAFAQKVDKRSGLSLSEPRRVRVPIRKDLFMQSPVVCGPARLHPNSVRSHALEASFKAEVIVV